MVVALVLILQFVWKKKKRHTLLPLLKKDVVILCSLVLGLGLGAQAALAVTYGMAFWQTKHFVEQANSHPDQVGILLGRDSVASELAKRDKLPDITLAEDPSAQQ